MCLSLELDGINKPVTPLYVDMQQYGEENFTLETLCIVPRDKLNEMEAYWADQLCTYIWDKSPYFSRGYNMTLCGVNLSYTEEYKFNLSLSIKRSIQNRTTAHWWKGRKHKPETIEKLRKINIGRKMPEHVSKILSKIHKGKTASAEGA